MEIKMPVSASITRDYEFLNNPEPSEWSCELFGCNNYGLVLRPQKGHEPNWFWRKMQYLILGNKWIKDFSWKV